MGRVRWIMLVVLAAASPLVRARADGISATVTLQAQSGFLDHKKITQRSFAFVAASPSSYGGTQTIGTNTPALVGFGDVPVSSRGWAYFGNTQATNVYAPLAIGTQDNSGNFFEFLRLYPGEFHLGPLGTNAVYALAIGTNSVVMEKSGIQR